MVIQNIEESIITLSGNKINLVNDSFINFFQTLINSENDKNEDELSLRP